MTTPATPAFPVQLPPPSPALEMHQAAARLRELADPAQRDLDTEDYWACYDPAMRWRDGLVNGYGGVTAELAAVFSPPAAHALADWLDTEARVEIEDQAALQNEGHPACTTENCTTTAALRLARLINQTQE